MSAQSEARDSAAYHESIIAYRGDPDDRRAW